jgi:hypothetical protein
LVAELFFFIKEFIAVSSSELRSNIANKVTKLISLLQGTAADESGWPKEGLKFQLVETLVLSKTREKPMHF